MIIFPAIDLMDGAVVRLSQGDPAARTSYGSDPLAVVDRFCQAGATWLHVVDLSGAFAGTPSQRAILADIVEHAHNLGARVQVAGGLRTPLAVRAALDSGADRAVIGTLAVEAPDEAARLCAEHPGRIVVAVDARDGQVAVDGWRTAAPVRADDLGRAAAGWGAAALLFTDVSRDGLQTGPAVEATAALQAQVPVPVLASGGVGSLAHLDALARAKVAGVVVGRALYEGNFTVQEALARC